MSATDADGWGRWRRLGREVLGLNRRNAEYIDALNPIARLPLVDDKVQTKQRLSAAGIAVPATYAVLATRRAMMAAASLWVTHERFVVKPARGYGGGGVLLGACLDTGTWRINGELWDRRRLHRHVLQILDGVYALDERADQALVEERLECDGVFAEYVPHGVPDLRVLVCRGVPVMAMLRVPTRRSRGRANLHAGAVGVGIDLRTGVTRDGVYRDYSVRRHPDSGRSLAGFTLPRWRDCLEIATRAADAVELGIVGADLVWDQIRGPMVLELNARPGLQIQLANGRGLRPLLERLASGGAETQDTVSARVALGQAMA